MSVCCAAHECMLSAGPVSKIRLLGDYHHPTRIAFVEFTNAESARAALNCSGAMLGGHMLFSMSYEATPYAVLLFACLLICYKLDQHKLPAAYLHGMHDLFCLEFGLAQFLSSLSNTCETIEDSQPVCRHAAAVRRFYASACFSFQDPCQTRSSP